MITFFFFISSHIAYKLCAHIQFVMRFYVCQADQNIKTICIKLKLHQGSTDFNPFKRCQTNQKISSHERLLKLCLTIRCDVIAQEMSFIFLLLCFQGLQIFILFTARTPSFRASVSRPVRYISAVNMHLNSRSYSLTKALWSTAGSESYRDLKDQQESLFQSAGTWVSLWITFM